MARHVVGKLWREFISDEPDSVEIDHLADSFRQNKYSISALLADLFLSPHFWASAQRGCLIKSPVELMVGTARIFNLASEEPMQLVRYGRRLGQDLFDPPNVKGWPGGTRWITTATLLDRSQMLHRAIRGHETGHVHEQEMAGMARAQGASWLAREPIDIIQDTLLPLSPVQPLDSDGNRTQAIRQCVLDPVYQLK